MAELVTVPCRTTIVIVVWTLIRLGYCSEDDDHYRRPTLSRSSRYLIAIANAHAQYILLILSRPLPVCLCVSGVRVPIAAVAAIRLRYWRFQR